jgi:hypothetical protein
MSAKSVKRIAVISAAAALAAAGAFASYHRSRALTPSEEASSLISELPASAPFLAYVDTAAFRDSTFLNDALALSPAPTPSSDYAKFVRESGFDFHRDLDRFAMAVEPNPDGSDSTVTVIADGRFDQAKISAYANTHDGTTSTRHGQPYFVFHDTDRNRTFSLTLISPNRVRLVSGKSGITVIAGSVPAPQPTYPPAAQHLPLVAGSPMFAIAETDGFRTQSAQHLGQYADSMKGLRWVTLTAAPQGDSLNIAIEGECNSLQDAQKFESVLNMAKAFVPAMLTQDSVQKKLGPNGVEAATNLVNSVQVTRNDAQVRLAFAITTDLLNELSSPAKKTATGSSR